MNKGNTLRKSVYEMRTISSAFPLAGSRQRHFQHFEVWDFSSFVLKLATIVEFMYPVGQRKYRWMSYPHYLARRGKEEEWTGEIKGLWSEEAWCDLVCCDAFLPPPHSHSLNVCVCVCRPQPSHPRPATATPTLWCRWWWGVWRVGGGEEGTRTMFHATDKLMADWLSSFLPPPISLSLPLPCVSLSLSFFPFPFFLFPTCSLSPLSITLYPRSSETCELDQGPSLYTQ